MERARAELICFQAEDGIRDYKVTGVQTCALPICILLIVNLLTLGIIYQALQLPEKAMGAHLEALKIAESLSAKRYIAMSASLLCAVSVFAEDWEVASRYAMRALAARDPHEVIFAETPRWPETAALLHAGDSEQASKDLHLFDEIG